MLSMVALKINVVLFSVIFDFIFARAFSVSNLTENDIQAIYRMNCERIEL